ncbi:ORC-CDC6 family AAA ATPase [Anaeromyxobacter oryzae]|uniref:ORC-CDC6 family AAA ATPase n=1 Tax=Anaeromyxobacter oryzae TaxID=2918170 RepID=UPI0020BD83D6|nr:hypothetical protein [Anaeromyxobacter oryzae]
MNTAFLKLPLRAEGEDPSLLVKTFVDVAHLFTVLSNDDHQVLYGRRGTGKTHALKYLVEYTRSRRQVSLYVDMRTIGSSGGLYSDDTAPLSERATRLLMDTLLAIHDQLATFALGDSDLAQAAQPELLPRLDALAEVATEVRVAGTVEQHVAASESASEKASGSASLDTTGKLTMAAGTDVSQAASVERRRTEKGQEVHRVHFGSASKRLADVVAALPGARLWLMLDEWSVIPRDLQPYLADFLRRCMLPVKGMTVKIGAIEQRSWFRLGTNTGDYVGLELGADISANLDLDDFMVFNNDPERAKAFLRDLLFRHVRAIYASEGNEARAPRTADELVSLAFTQVNAFAEYVRASEGVPRDAVNILGLAAQKAFEEKISVQHVRSAARAWYQRDKLRAVNANESAADLLTWIISEVIGNRHARAFLLEQGRDHQLIGTLYDARVLHVLKRGVHGGDIAGVRFNVYALDYGCYVDLATTSNAPRGLFAVLEEDGTERFVEVPQDDYRSIRRAILDLAAFERYLGERTRGGR